MPGRNAIALAEISQQASQRCIRATLLYDNLSCPHAEEHPRGEHKSFLSAVEDLRNIWRGRADYSGLMLAAGSPWPTFRFLQSRMYQNRLANPEGRRKGQLRAQPGGLWTLRKKEAIIPQSAIEESGFSWLPEHPMRRRQPL
jgi:hypothetical protein